MNGRIPSEIMRGHLRMYLVIGSVNCKKEPEAVVQEALAGGATMVQFREKGRGALDGEPRAALGGRIRQLCRKAGVPFIVNDDVDLALRLDADGVHIGQDDEAADVVRQRIGSRILGVSAYTVEEARRAIRHGADYVGVGPIYATASKADAKEAQGPSMIRAMRAAGIDLPLVGIGGITAERSPEVISAGADGVAVISAVTQAAKVRDEVTLIKERVIGTKQHLKK